MADDDQQWKIAEVPPIVQELAAGVQEPPTRYMLSVQDRPSAAVSDMPPPTPVVDLSQLADADQAAKLRSALQNWGLFLAVGHGMEPDFLAEVMRVTRGFYELPPEEKQKYSNLVNGKEFRVEGYGNDMVVSEKQILDWCDRFYLVVEPESRRIYSLWPTHPPSFRDVVSEYTAKCREIAMAVLGSLAMLLDLREDYFADMLDEDAVTYARFNYYPPCPRPDRVFGLKPHSDGSAITVVLVDDGVSGLQVQNNGVWHNVPIVPNSLLVNLGDAMEIRSNGIYKSPVHRVVTNTARERVSVAMFYSLNMEKEIEPAPELVDKRTPRRYGKVKAKDYIVELLENFARGARAIDTVRT